jgi:ABC-type uncharacterized transport system auxiliary subunit
MRYGLVALLLSFAVLGCARQPVQPLLRYALDPAIQVDSATPTDLTLGIRPLEFSLPYKNNIVYRAEGHRVGQYPDAQWVELPRDMVTRAITDAVIATKRFHDVGNAGDLSRPDLLLVGYLRRFDEVRTESPWVALCEVRLELREALGSAALWSDTLSVSVPLAQNDLKALPEAMNLAVSQIAQEAAKAISKY